MIKYKVGFLNFSFGNERIIIFLCSINKILKYEQKDYIRHFSSDIYIFFMQ